MSIAIETWRRGWSADEEMGATTRAVLHGLSIIAEERKGLAFGFDYETLEKWSGASRRTIRRHLKRAEACGWLTRDKTWVELTHREKSDFRQNRSDCPDRVTGQNDRPDRMTGQSDRSDNLTGQNDRSDKLTGHSDRSETEPEPPSTPSPEKNKSFSHSSKENSSPNPNTPTSDSNTTDNLPPGTTTTDEAGDSNSGGARREPRPPQPDDGSSEDEEQLTQQELADLARSGGNGLEEILQISDGPSFVDQLAGFHELNLNPSQTANIWAQVKLDAEDERQARKYIAMKMSSLSSETFSDRSVHDIIIDDFEEWSSGAQQTAGRNPERPSNSYEDHLTDEDHENPDYGTNEDTVIQDELEAF